MYIIDPTIGGDDAYTVWRSASTLRSPTPGRRPATKKYLARQAAANLRTPSAQQQDLGEGYYLLQRFQRSRADCDFERDLKLTEEVMRYLLTVVE
jgi:hypothetical protein